MTERDESQAGAGKAETGQGKGVDLGTPPYPAYRTFTNYVSEMKESVIPNRIDAGAMVTKSGADQSALRTAMRFFGLTDDQDRPQPNLRKLCDAYGTPGWQQAVKDYLIVAYQPIVEGLDLSRATTPQLTERFRATTSASNSTMSKAIRFYLAALKDAEIEYSPYIKAPRVSSRAKRKKKAEQEGGNGSETPMEEKHDEPMKMHSFNVPGRDAPVRVSAYPDITTKEWKMVAAFMEAYIALSVDEDESDNDE